MHDYPSGPFDHTEWVYFQSGRELIKKSPKNPTYSLKKSTREKVPLKSSVRHFSGEIQKFVIRIVIYPLADRLKINLTTINKLMSIDTNN